MPYVVQCLGRTIGQGTTNVNAYRVNINVMPLGQLLLVWALEAFTQRRKQQQCCSVFRYTLAAGQLY